MTFILKPDAFKNTWVLVSEYNKVISGPKYFADQPEAERWANAFISTWSAAKLEVRDVRSS